jgi:hypothetical protein
VKDSRARLRVMVWNEDDTRSPCSELPHDIREVGVVAYRYADCRKPLRLEYLDFFGRFVFP